MMNQLHKFMISTFGCIALASLLASCNLSFLGNGSIERPEGEFSYDCSPRLEDPNRYLVSVCEYLNQNQIWVGDFSTFEINRIQEQTGEQGQPVLILYFNCCGMGDSATIDQETGEVLGYQLGIY